MSDEAKRLKKRRTMEQVRSVEQILRQWDPWGLLPGELAPRDEYDGHALQIVSMLAHGCSVASLTEHLASLRLSGTAGSADPASDMAAAQAILDVFDPLDRPAE